MTSPTRTTPAPAGYLSGHCAVRNHRTCRGTYASALCGCDCHRQTQALQAAEYRLEALRSTWHEEAGGQREQDLRDVIDALAELLASLGATS